MEIFDINKFHDFESLTFVLSIVCPCETTVDAISVINDRLIVKREREKKARVAQGRRDNGAVTFYAKSLRTTFRIKMTWHAIPS